jgi:hypothetical protein
MKNLRLIRLILSSFLSTVPVCAQQLSPDPFKVGVPLKVPIQNALKYFDQFFEDADKRNKDEFETTSEWLSRIKQVGIDTTKVLYFKREVYCVSKKYNADLEILKLEICFMMELSDSYRKGEFLTEAELLENYPRKRENFRYDYCLKLRNVELLKPYYYVIPDNERDMLSISFKLPRKKAKEIQKDYAVVLAVNELSYSGIYTEKYSEDSYQSFITANLVGFAIIYSKTKEVLWSHWFK